MLLTNRQNITNWYMTTIIHCSYQYSADDSYSVHYCTCYLGLLTIRRFFTRLSFVVFGWWRSSAGLVLPGSTSDGERCWLVVSVNPLDPAVCDDVVGPVVDVDVVGCTICDDALGPAIGVGLVGTPLTSVTVPCSSSESYRHILPSWSSLGRRDQHEKTPFPATNCGGPSRR